jgi:hypothetical protein
MAYVDYLPTEALIIKPSIVTTGLPVTGYSERSLYEFPIMSYGYILASDTIESASYINVGAMSQEHSNYAQTTYTEGSYVVDTVANLVFRCLSATLDCSTPSLYIENHPSRLNSDGTRATYDRWGCYGVPNNYKHVSSSSSELLSLSAKDAVTIVDLFPASSVLPVLKFTFTFANPKLCLFGVDANKIIVELRQSGGTLIEEFVIDMTYKDRIYLNLFTTPISCFATIYIVGESSVQNDYELIMDASPKIGTAVIPEADFPISLGSQLMGHSSNRVSEFKTVISDGVEKSIVTKSYDTFDGHVMVDEADLQKAEFTLAKATQGDYVFHIGSGTELYDQRVYLGKIKYRSPIENGSKYKISISGQSLSYGVENPLIAPDSTDGYAQ